MKRTSLILSLLLLFAGGVFADGTQSQSNLPICPEDPESLWTNCIGTHTLADGNQYVGEWKDDKYHGQGTFTYASGNKYVGEFKDGKKHGQGTYTYADGEKYSGYWMNGKFVPDICEGMGLSKGTSEFGQCELKLIDKI